ncbi:hypothetical protein WKW44_08620 [Staphylococcus saprophyticus]|uniref:hypothetical protein n=1 Tax=Staphylococcus saprophyticus TaxID=29385 RepID=UPI00297310C2|nr:hypothetical protein [Staphylococcus saprophyticus]
MTYEFENKINEAFLTASRDGRNVNRELLAELQEVYKKAKAWDRLYDMILDEDMTVREFDDEMYELLKQTGKTDIRIITDPSIRMEDE